MHETAVQKTSSAQAREDLLAMFRQMSPSLGTLVLVYFLATMGWLAASALTTTWLGAYVLRMLMFMGLAYAAAPFTLALYRFVALREVRWMPPLGRYDERTRIFATYASLMTALYFVPPLGRELVNAFGLNGDVAWFALCAVVWVIVIRLSALLPMAALDTRSASWRRAFALSKGRAMPTFVATTAPAAPAFIALILLALFVARGAVHPVVFYPVAVVVLLAVQLLPLSAATRLYLEQRRAGTQ